MPDAPVHQVLWTGGWDSTFRVLDLVLVHGRRVRPWYVVDPERRTTRRELETMDVIRRRLAERDAQAAGRIAALEVRHLSEIPVDPGIAAAAGRLRDLTQVPAQYEWLAMFARHEGLEDLELGVEDGAGTSAFAGVEPVRADAPPPDDWWFAPADGTAPDSYAIAGRFRLPIWDLQKSDLGRLAQERGFADIMELTWFCRWPTLRGRPCGFCVPCRGTMLGGLQRRVPAPTRTRRVLHEARWGLVRRGAVLRANAGSVGARLGRARD